MTGASRTLIKLIGALMAMLTVLSLVACNVNSDENGESNNAVSDSETESGTVEFVESLTLFADGKTDFKVIYPEECDEAVFSAAKTIVTAFDEVGGVEIEYEGDFVKRGEEPDSEAFEILVGDTNRPETQMQKEVLKDQTGYMIVMEGNKLVIYGHTITAVANAANYFVRNYIREPAEATEEGKLSKLIFTSNDEYIYQKEFAIKSIKIDGVELTEYKIVVPEMGYVEKYVAQLFCRHLIRYYGYVPEIITDATSPAEHELIIGKTTRSTLSAEDGKYNIAVTDAGFEAVASSALGYADVLGAMQNKIFDYGKSAVSVAKGESFTGNAASNTLDNSGNLTVMYHNVLGYQSEYVVANRADMALQIYMEYAPDVIGFEEFGGKYRAGAQTLLDGLAAAGYGEICYKNEGGTGNPIFYNKNTLDLVESGYLASRTGDKGTTWAVLEHKATQKKFAVTNSHFAANSNANNDEILANEYRKQDAATAVTVVENIKSKYADILIFTGGDFNSTPDSEPYKVLTDGGLTNVRESVAKSTDFGANNGYPKYNKDYGYYELGNFKSNVSEWAIDHIMVSGDMTGVSLLEYGLATDRVSCSLSDHLPQLLAVKLS